MTEGIDINELIMSTIAELCKDRPELQELVSQALEYEMDIWNRRIVSSEIEGQYDLIVSKIVKRMEQ